MQATAQPIQHAGVRSPQSLSQQESYYDSHSNGARATDGTPLLNVDETERYVSLAAGAILAGLGASRGDLRGLVIAGIGGALAYRGATGHCHVYETMGIDTSHRASGKSLRAQLDEHGVQVTECFLIGKPQEELYNWWRDFSCLPTFMSHLKSVRPLDDKRSEWIATAPAIAGGEIRWEAEITADQPNERIAWQTVEGSAVQHRGSVSFTKAAGDRGTNVRVDLQYDPPAGQIGEWVAWMFGEEPKQQIRSDLRKFKRLMETGEIPTIEGQSHGTCAGMGLARFVGL